MHCVAVYVKTWLSAKKDLKPFTSWRWPSWDVQLHVWWYKVFVYLPWFLLYVEYLFPVSLVNIARLRVVQRHWWRFWFSGIWRCLDCCVVTNLHAVMSHKIIISWTLLLLSQHFAVTEYIRLIFFIPHSELQNTSYITFTKYCMLGHLVPVYFWTLCIV